MKTSAKSIRVWHATCVTKLFFSYALLSAIASADGPADNLDTDVRRIPPVGITLADETRDELLNRIEAIEKDIPKLPQSTATVDWWNDIRVITRGVRLTIEGSQFAKEQEVDQARKLLALADSRADELSLHFKNSKYVPTWTKQAGRIVLGHRSKLDDTVQPFSVTIPTSVVSDLKKPRRLDIWLHGRDENVSEVGFLFRRMTQDPQYAPADTIVLQPWGRYSNAFRFAGEVDVLEALAEVQRRYAIDPNRVAIRGFSMGGAGCWHLAVHHADRFFAANPGAGFCETLRFLSGFQGETLNPSDVQRKLWNLHDCPPVVLNLKNLPTVAYSGGQDRQKEAADIMVEAAREAGLRIPYIIHPESGHAIHADAKRDIEGLMNEYAKFGRAAIPSSVHWSTFTLKYSKAYWLELTRLEEHWRQAEIEASFNEKWDQLHVTTDNVRSFAVRIPANQTIPASTDEVQVVVDGRLVGMVKPASNRAMMVDLVQQDGEWHFDASSDDAKKSLIEKRPGLQGPIDDAFMSRFIIVKPTGKSGSPLVDAWCERELEHAVEHWRRQFRGDAIVKDDTDIDADDAKSANLICFGTPACNRYLQRCAEGLKVKWTGEAVVLGNESFDAATTAPILIQPNPLAPHRYLVLNSGFTYREYDYLNNARQTPKLGDWAFIDAESPMTSRGPGKILAEGFFDESWQPK